ncbi:MAG: BatA domain-containing protein [Verrucomicrobiales bacterium]
MNFIHPMFLAALGVLSIPLAIHFLRSRKLRNLDLGTLRFVREAVAETTRWQRLREWLLLAARLIMVALAALLFARPFLHQDTPPPGSESGLEWLFVLDASASMRFTAPGTATPGSIPPNASFEEFQDRLAETPEGVKSLPFAFADSLETVPEPSAAASLVGGPCDFAALVRWLRDHAASAPHVPRRVILFTDLQQPLSPLPDDLTWPEDIPVEIVSALPPATRNLAPGTLAHRLQPMGEALPKDHTSPTGTQSDTRKLVTLEIPVLRVGDPQPLKLIADSGAGSATAGLARKEYPPGSTSVELTLAPEKPGLMDAVVRLHPADAWPMDDVRAYAVQFIDREPVLLVDGDPGDDDDRPRDSWEAPGGSPFASEVYYLRHALAAPDRGQGHSVFDPAVTRDLSRDLDARRWKAIALCNVRSLDDDTLQKLVRRVEAGCGLLIFPGDRIDLAGWRRIFDAGLSPAELELLPEPAVPRPLAEWDARHPVLAGFAAREQGDLSRFILRDRIRVIPAPNAEVLASLDGDRPALVTTTRGLGRIVLFANPADRDWTDFPSERMYLPFIHALVGYAAQVGVSAAAGLPPDRPLSLSDRRSPGRHEDAVLHVSEDESTAPFLDEESFRQALRLGAPPASVRPAEEEAWREVEGAPRPREWWPWLALALLIFIIAETFLADHKRPARRPA